MKKTKTTIVLCTALALILALSSCAGNSVQQGVNNYNNDIFDIEEIKYDPASFIGPITIIGIVADSSTQDFALQDEAGTFVVLVDYRGSQALPQAGDRIAVHGQLLENRPCCGPGLTIMSMGFEEAE